MAIFSHYGTGQRVGFIFVCFGISLCLIGSIAPYWLTAQTSIKDVSNLLDDVMDHFGVGDVTLFDLRIGIWYYCIDIPLEEKCYSMYDTSDEIGPDMEKDRFSWIDVVRGLVIINILLGLMSGLIACCRCMCCSGGRTICHGVLSFFAGAFGMCAFAVFSNKTKSLLNVPLVEFKYNWAAGIFVVGSILLIVASLILCCALPRETSYGLVVAGAAPSPGISVNVSNTNTNTNSNVNQYNAAGHIQSFEPLPYVVGPPPPQSLQPMGQNSLSPYYYNQPGPSAYTHSNPGYMPPADIKNHK